MSNITNSTDEEIAVIETFESRLFWIIFFCSFSMICLFCFYFYFYHLFQQRQTLLYKKLNNHTLLCLVITDYLMIQTELPMTIGFLMKNRVIIETKSFCVFWNYWYYVWSTLSIQFSMLTAINRYLLVFHKTFLLQHKVFCHYLPMICIWLYIPCLHLYFIVFFPYGNTTFDFSKVWCGGPQFVFITLYVSWDTLFDTFTPIIIIVLFNLIIITKAILFKKIKTNSTTKWKKNRRMILQIIGICCCQLVGGIPYCIITLGVIYVSPTFALDIYTQVFIYAFYIPSLCSPLFAIITMPKAVRGKIALIFRYLKTGRSAAAPAKGIISATGISPSGQNQLQFTNIRPSVAASTEQSSE